MANPQTQREYWSGKVGVEWARHAANIDAMLRSVTGAALELAAFQPGERVLDIGCGAGATCMDIARAVGAGGSVVGADLSPQMLEVARARARETPNVEFVEADVASARFDPPFDAAFSRFGVMFFEEPGRAFAHIRSNLRANGRLVFVCWRPLQENGWATTAIEAILPMLKEPLTPPNPDAPGPFSLADADKIRRVLGEGGWRDVNVAPWTGPIPIGGGGSIDETADFMLRIGPCARAIADQELDVGEARRRLVERLTALHSAEGVLLPAACWIASARA